MKRVKILTVILALAALCMGMLSGCDNGKDNLEIGDGPFYTLEQAYETGWLTKDDIMEVCYYRFGVVWLGENLDSDSWVRCEYDPKHTRQKLDKSVENNIKKTYYSIHKSEFFNKDGDKLGGIEDLSVQYFGTYIDSHVIVMKCSLWDIGQVATPTLLAGVAWWETGEGFLVYRVY